MRTAQRPAIAWNRKALLATLAVALLVAAGCGRTSVAAKPDGAGSDTVPLAQPDTSSAVSDLPATTSDTATTPIEDALTVPDLLASDPPTNRDLPTTNDLPGDRFQPAEVADVSAMDLSGSSDGGSSDRPLAIDLQQPIDASGDPPRLGWDIGYSPDAAGLAESCTQTGGTVGVVSCWMRTDPYAEFFDTCALPLIACTCSYTCTPVIACSCPNQGCFLPAYGCVGRAAICTVGEDQSCNDNPALSSIRGKCLDGGHCLCGRSGLNPTSGKCL